MVSAHAMHAASRRCRRGAKVEAFDRSLIRVETQNRTSEELLEVIGSSSDVSAHEICIRVFKLCRVFGVAGQNKVAKAGSEPLHLGFDGSCHIEGGPIRNVAIRPGRVPSRGRAGRIEKARLRQQDERSLAVFAVPGGCFSGLDLLQTASQVQRPSARALRIAPGDWTVERAQSILNTPGPYANRRRLRR